MKGKSPARISKSVQRYFPQCASCCSKQATAVKAGATRLVFHFYGMRPWYYAGEACLALSHLHFTVQTLSRVQAGQLEVCAFS